MKLPWKHKSTPYQVLGVSKSASAKEIKQKYYELSFTHHPDRTSSLTPREKEHLHARFMEIQAAHELLKDEEQRRQYDQYGGSAFSVTNRNNSKHQMRWDWNVQEPGTQPPGEFKMFRPWAYGALVLIVATMLTARVTVRRKAEMEEQAWRDWSDARREEGVYFPTQHRK